jgi:hypothetical protein
MCTQDIAARFMGFRGVDHMESVYRSEARLRSLTSHASARRAVRPEATLAIGDRVKTVDVPGVSAGKVGEVTRKDAPNVFVVTYPDGTWLQAGADHFQKI